MTEIHRGKCLCGAVKLEGRGAVKVEVCHCTMCRRWHGGPALVAEFESGAHVVDGADDISVYESSEWAERGFCSKCGSTLFYRLKSKRDEHSALAGLFELPAATAIYEHIFVDQKAHYYEFADDAPRLTGEETIAKFMAANADN